MLLDVNMMWMLSLCMSLMYDSLPNVYAQRVYFNYFRLGFSPNRFSPEWLRKREANLETIRPLHLIPT
jgi:hypothetical protein